ncbi:uncharacterized protein itprid1 [Salarias fasciatus]|uniref:uncharacterized protein itprid1 n=1 Tax=Salarias fasciatus TaxID=181472 RepID=UPI001176DA03|nr:uncharacterized protein LOC115394804 [Salarias fasciatus]
MQAFLQQLEAEGRVYWAEPVQLSNSTSSSTPVPEESSSLDASEATDRQMERHESVCSKTSSSSSTMPLPKTPGRSVSLQMSSGLSTHIVHRKDVPYMDKSKQASLPCILPLDTSTPFRAVQSWTDLQIKRKPDQTQEAVTSLPQCVPPLSIDWQSHETTTDLAPDDDAVSVDTGLWPDEQDSIDGHDPEETMFWEVARCSSCGHRWSSCSGKCRRSQHAFTHSDHCEDEDEQMMKSLQRFGCVLSHMEDQLSEAQAAVYCSLSDTDRETVRDIEDLRRAVKQEAALLEVLLSEVSCLHDESMKMKMDSLLEEQSLVCSQLRILPGSASLSPIGSRSVATQCCLLPGEDLDRSPRQTDRLEPVSFLQRMKTSCIQ